MGATSIRPSLRPLNFRGVMLFQNSDTSCRENTFAYSLRCRCPAWPGNPVSQRRLGSSAAASGILDRPVKPGDDGE